MDEKKALSEQQHSKQEKTKNLKWFIIAGITVILLLGTIVGIVLWSRDSKSVAEKEPKKSGPENNSVAELEPKKSGPISKESDFVVDELFESQSLSYLGEPSYYNSVIQSLFACRRFRRAIFDFKPEPKKNTMAGMLSVVFSWFDNVKPSHDVLKNLHKEIANRIGPISEKQRDPIKIFSILADGLYDEIDAKGLFYGVKSRITTCKTHGNSEPVIVLTFPYMPVPPAATKTEIMSIGDQQSYPITENCVNREKHPKSKSDCIQVNRVWSFVTAPKVLVIHFSGDVRPKNLGFHENIAFNTDEGVKTNYRLKATIAKKSKDEYVAFTQSSDAWYCRDSSPLKEVKYSDIEAQPVYMLFYEQWYQVKN